MFIIDEFDQNINLPKIEFLSFLRKLNYNRWKEQKNKKKWQNLILKWNSNFILRHKPGHSIKIMIKYSAKRLHLNRFDISKSNNRFRFECKFFKCWKFQKSHRINSGSFWQTLSFEKSRDREFFWIMKAWQVSLH